MTSVSLPLRFLEAGPQPPRCSPSPRICLTQVVFQQTLAQGEQKLVAAGCSETRRTVGTHTAGEGCECRGATRGEDAHGTGWAAGGRPHCHGPVCTAVPGRLRERGAFSSLGAFEEPPNKGGTAPRRAGRRARACSRSRRGRARGFSGEGPAEEVAPRRGLPGEECRAAGCDDSRPHTSRKCRERNQVEGANKAGAPGGRRSAARDLPSG